MEFHVEEHPDPNDIDALEAEVSREASAAMGLGDEEDLVIFVRDAGVVVAGISGWTWGDCCELQNLWVDPSLRGHGLATRLIAAAEAEAAARGCAQTVHFTYDFQARDLYDRNGYELVGRVEDFPSGTDVLWYRKRLKRPESGDPAFGTVEATPNPAAGLSKARMEGFSDAVMAIAITLLVLELALQPPGSPLGQFLRAWPAYMAYLVSFLTIGAAWIAHNALTDRLERTDRILLRLNLLFLLLVAFLPYPTRLVAEAWNQDRGAERVAAVVYGITVLSIRLTFFLLDAYTRREHLLPPGVDDPDLQEERRKFRYVVVGYTAAIATSAFFPFAGVALYSLIAIFLIVPFRAVAKFLSTGEHE